MLIAQVLPAGIGGIVLASYFSAIMSTGDSCLMASSGNFLNDIIERYWLTSDEAKESVKYSVIVTFVVGILAVSLAAQFTTVLDAILHAYAFMVGGLFIPTLGAYFWARGSSAGALAGMLGGGLITLLLQLQTIGLPESISNWGFDPSLYGIFSSALLYIGFSLALPDKKIEEKAEATEE